jgi:hypothetical protein
LSFLSFFFFSALSFFVSDFYGKSSGSVFKLSIAMILAPSDPGKELYTYVFPNTFCDESPTF